MPGLRREGKQAMERMTMSGRIGWVQMAGLKTKLGLLGSVAALSLGLVGMAAANPFDPVMTVNGRAITEYELSQRSLFLEILRQPGDLQTAARTTLIEDRLRMAAADEAGITLTPDQTMAGMTEFAARANMTTEEFLKATGQMGLDPESFRDFIEAGVVWREVVRAKFAASVVITEAEIDRAIANLQPTGALKLKLIQIPLPAVGKDQSEALARARKIQSKIKTEADFLSAAQSNGGGDLGWNRLSELPESARKTLARQAPGTMSAPVKIDDKLVLYWVSERGEDPINKAEGPWVDYAQFLVPAGPTAEADLAAARAQVDACDDLYTVAKGLPADRVLRKQEPQSAVGGEVGAVLATLDAGETSTRIARDGWRVLLMLCSRGPSPDLVPDRDIIREQLLNQRLGSLADIYLEELRSEAILTEE